MTNNENNLFKSMGNWNLDEKVYLDIEVYIT